MDENIFFIKTIICLCIFIYIFYLKETAILITNSHKSYGQQFRDNVRLNILTKFWCGMLSNDIETFTHIPQKLHILRYT
jgi:hypothetical protein